MSTFRLKHLVYAIGAIAGGMCGLISLTLAFQFNAGVSVHAVGRGHPQRIRGHQHGNRCSLGTAQGS